MCDSLILVSFLGFCFLIDDFFGVALKHYNHHLPNLVVLFQADKTCVFIKHDSFYINLQPDQTHDFLEKHLVSYNRQGQPHKCHELQFDKLLRSRGTLWFVSAAGSTATSQWSCNLSPWAMARIMLILRCRRQHQ